MTLTDIMQHQLLSAGVPQPSREMPFLADRGWRFDFAWPGSMVALEVEGGQWVRGRHTRAMGYERDCEKYSEAAIAGWLVVRATGDMVRDGRAVLLVSRALAAVRGQA